MRGRTAPLFALLLAACGGSRDASPTPVPVDAGALLGTWPLVAALSTELDEAALGAAAQRWLGGAGGWRAPGDAAGAAPALARRVVEEDAAAIEHLRVVWLSAACRLAQDGRSFDDELALGFRAGADACQALGQPEAAARAQTLADARSGTLEYRPNGAISEVPVTAVEVLRGESRLRYVFVRPLDLEARRVDLLRQVSAEPGPTQSVTERFLRNVGSERWGIDTPALPSSSTILAALPRDSARLAAIDEALSSGTQVWRASLEAAAQSTPALDASTRATLEGWAGRALRRALGVALLEAGEPTHAMAVLEEAAGSQVRARPGPGLDPLLLAALARARYESNDLRRAVDLLEDIGAEAGWELAHEAARVVAREAAMPSAVEAKVNR